MSRIRSRNTTPELAVRRAAHALGLRYRLHSRDLPGRPDLAFPRQRIAVFVHGCFWHRHPGCPNCTTPKTRVDFWQAKFDTNIARDRRVNDEIARLGWSAMVIWECETEDPVKLANHLEQLKLNLKGEPAAT